MLRYALYSEWLESPDPFIRANALICLIHQENYMLDKQGPALEDQFITEGGYSENLAAERLAYRREHSNQTDRTDDKGNPMKQQATNALKNSTSTPAPSWERRAPSRHRSGDHLTRSV